MTATWRSVVWGSPGAPRVELIGGFAAVVAVAMVATALSNGLGAADPIGRFLYDVGLPATLFYAPGVVAAVGAFLRCGAATCLVAGLVPAAVFATVAIVGTALGLPGVGGGDAPLWSISLAFATISVVAAAAGCLAGFAARFVSAVASRS